MRFSKVCSIYFLAAVIPVSARVAYRSEGTWLESAPIPIAPRQEHSVVTVSDTTIAIVGGILPNPSGPGFNTTSILQFYDIPSDTWSLRSAAPIAANHANVAVADGKIYFLGGLSVAADGAWRAFSESWAYDPSADSWTELSPVPEEAARGSAAMGVVGSTVFMAGGMRTLEPIGVEGEQDTVDFVSAYETTSDTWVALPDAAAVLPEGRDHAGAAIVGGKLYVLGGRTCGQYNVRDTVFVLDTADLEAGWVTADGRMPTARGGVASAAVGNQVYIFGGEGNPSEGSEGMFDQVEVYNVEADEWKQLAPMPVPRHGGAAAAAGGRIYLPGGGIGVGASPVDLNSVYVLA
jgi:N-acetylneuraminic acid mutarotase